MSICVYLTYMHVIEESKKIIPHAVTTYYFSFRILYVDILYFCVWIGYRFLFYILFSRIRSVMGYLCHMVNIIIVWIKGTHRLSLNDLKVKKKNHKSRNKISTCKQNCYKLYFA